MEPCRLVFEAAVAPTVPSDMVPSLATAGPSGSRSRRCLVPDVERFARGSPHGSFDQGRQLVLAAVPGQVYPAPSAEAWKPNDGLETTLIQGAGGGDAGFENGDILPPLLVEAAETVEELEVRQARPGRSPGRPTFRGQRGRRTRELPLHASELLRDGPARRATKTTRATASRSSRDCVLIRSARKTYAEPSASSAPRRGRDWLLRTAVSMATWRS